MSNNMVWDLNLFYSYKPVWGLLFQDKGETFLLLLSSSIESEDSHQTKKTWMVHMETLRNESENKFTHDIYTSSSVLYNNFGNLGVKFIDTREEKMFIFDLHEICLSRSLYFSSDVSKRLFGIQMARWQEKYELGLVVPFFPKK